MVGKLLGRYELPHACETAEIAGALARLNAKQRRVLREYIWQVELGGKGVTEWLRQPGCPVSERSWYTSGHKANYFHNETFQAALEAYKRAGQRWLLSEETRTIEAAQRKLRMGAERAADRMVDLVDNARTDMVKLMASKEVLDRADVATASKGPTGQVNVTELSDDELRAIAGGAESGRGDGAAAA